MKNKRSLLLFTVLMISSIGLISLYSALHTPAGFTGKSLFIKQIFWIALGWALLLVVYNINYRIFYDLSLWLYLISAVMLIMVAISGHTYMGAQRWLHIFGITFQPSELAKLAALLVSTRFFVHYRKSNQPFIRSFFHEVIIPFIPIAFLTLLIFIQPDLGTSLVVLGIYLIILIGAAGIKKRNIIIFFLLALMVIPIGWPLLKDYQKDRLLVFINPDSDPLGSGYTIIQSKIAIGSGGIFGKGFLTGTQNQLNFLPARHTDFIFTVFAEEWGFAGCLFLLALFYLFLKIILDTAGNAKDRYSYILSMGIFALFFIHIIINLSMVMGFMPVVGLPLPFLSYGGSFITVSFVLTGIILAIQKKQS